MGWGGPRKEAKGSVEKDPVLMEVVLEKRFPGPAEGKGVSLRWLGSESADGGNLLQLWKQGMQEVNQVYEAPTLFLKQF